MDKPILTMPSLWAILPGEKDRIELSYKSVLARDNLKVNHEAYIQAGLLDIDLDKLPETFFIDGAVAVMQIEGVLTPKSNFFSFLFGGATLDVLTRDFKALIENDGIKAIVLDIDSPGGNVFGIQEFANLVFESRSVKPIISITSSMMASAAMWIGAAAEDVFITGETTVTGSLAAATSHVDVSGLEQKIGLKTTEVSSGNKKRIDSSFAPLTEAGREELQKRVNHIGNVIASDIARFRDMDIEKVTKDMAEGQLFIGSMGIEAGLIDEIINPEELIDRINAEINNSAGNDSNFRGGKGMGGAITKKKDAAIMTAETLQEKHPEAYKEVFALGKTEERDGINSEIADAADKARIEGQAAGEGIGAKAERERIMDVRAQMVPGHEELIARLEADGTTTGPEAAVEVLAAIKEAQAKGLKGFEADASESIESDQGEEAQDEEDKEKKGKGFEALVADHQKEHNCSKAEAVKAIAASHPKEHEKYLADANK